MLLTITGYYQHISRNCVFLLGVCIVITAITLIMSIQIFDESPSYLHGKLRFDEAREKLAAIAKFNGVTEANIENTTFFKEAEL